MRQSSIDRGNHHRSGDATNRPQPPAKARPQSAIVEPANNDGQQRTTTKRLPQYEEWTERGQVDDQNERKNVPISHVSKRFGGWEYLRVRPCHPAPTKKTRRKKLPRELVKMGEGYDIADRTYADTLIRTDPQRLKGYITVDIQMLGQKGIVTSAIANRLIFTRYGLKIPVVARLFGVSHLGEVIKIALEKGSAQAAAEPLAEPQTRNNGQENIIGSVIGMENEDNVGRTSQVEPREGRQQSETPGGGPAARDGRLTQNDQNTSPPQNINRASGGPETERADTVAGDGAQEVAMDKTRGEIPADLAPSG